MVCMEVTVIFPAPPTVKKVRVTFKMEVAIHVVMDGQECIVKMVWCFKYVIFYLIINVIHQNIVYLIQIKWPVFFFNKHVQKDGTVPTVVNNVLDIVEVVLPVIT